MKFGPYVTKLHKCEPGLRTYKGFEKKEKERFHFTALVKNFPQNIKIVLTIYIVFDVNKKQ